MLRAVCSPCVSCSHTHTHKRSLTLSPSLSLPPFFFPAAASNFVDGDLIERFLDLPHGKMLEIASGFQRADDQGVLRDLSVHDIVQAVEEMTRLH